MNLVKNSLHSCGTLLWGTLAGLALIRTASGVIDVVGELSPIEVEIQSPMVLDDTPKCQQTS